MQSFPRLFFAAVLFGMSMPGCGGEQSDGNGAKRGMIPKRSSKPAPQTVQPSVAGPEEKPLREPTQHALLVGCTIYDNLPISAQLMGATNDVELMANLLTGTFDFPEKNVRKLSERTGKRADRPLRANICREFEQLTKRAGKGDRVVVLLSGHGTQQPDDDPDNADDPEPDGMDEVFCPADLDMDFAPGAKGIPNAITDDELRGWLQAIRERGASVWVVVDACHSGTSVRGTEVLRQIAPEQLLPREVLDAARPVSSTRGIHSETDALDGETDTGGLVAIYAAQPHEPTVEMRLPRNAADGQWHGLLTYTLVKVLTEAESKLTYTELVQRIHAEYISSRRIGPTPLIEGSDRHCEVLGKEQWPERSRLVLEDGRGGILELGAGSLHGLTVGTILAVYPPPGEKESEQPLGHVRIRRLRLAESIVEPCAYDPLPLRKDLPLGGRCEVVHWEYGDLRLRVAVDVSEADDTSEANATGDSSPELDLWRRRLEQAAAKEGAVFECVEEAEKAHWLVRIIDGKKLLLVPAEGWNFSAKGETAEFGPVVAAEEAIPWLEDRLGKIARASNLLRIGSRSKAQRLWSFLRGRSTRKGVRVQLVRLADEEDRRGKPIVWSKNGVQLQAGDLVGLRVENTSRYAIDFSLLFVDSGYGIDLIFPPPDSVVDNRLDPGGSHLVGPMQVDGDSLGLEHLVFVALKSEGEPVDFSWLAQESIDRARDTVATRAGGNRSFDSPLGKLLQQAIFAQGSQRGMKMVDTQSVFIDVISWQTAR